MKKTLLLALCSGLVLSCSSDNNTYDITSSEEVILPLKLVEQSGTDAEESNIKYNGSKIFEFTKSSGEEKSMFQYDGDYISKILTYNKEGQQDMTQAFTYNNGKITSKTVTEISNMGLPNQNTYVSTSTYQWVDTNHIIQTINHSTNGTPSSSSTTVDYYFSNGNLVKKIRISTSGNLSNKSEFNFSYDNKSNPWKNIKGMAALLDSDFALYNLNNLTKSEEIATYSNSGTIVSTSSYVTTYTNEYNSNNYLTKQVYKTTKTVNGSTTISGENIKSFTYNK